MSTRPEPNFAVIADSLIHAGSVVEAAQLCANGLSFYPDYLGGYAILAKAYSTMNRDADARIILEEARKRFPKHKVQVPREVAVSAPRVEEADTQRSHFPLRLVQTTNSVPEDQRIIRSASVRLIPGLEYTPLRFEGTRQRGRREIAVLLDPPAFRTFHPVRKLQKPSPATTAAVKKPVSLEDLAARLERARIPTIVENAPAAVAPEIGGPKVVTETLAGIYMKQGRYDLAIDSYRKLQETNPEKFATYAERIDECERLRSQ